MPFSRVLMKSEILTNKITLGSDRQIPPENQLEESNISAFDLEVNVTEKQDVSETLISK